MYTLEIPKEPIKEENNGILITTVVEYGSSIYLRYNIIQLNKIDLNLVSHTQLILDNQLHNGFLVIQKPEYVTLNKELAKFKIFNRIIAIRTDQEPNYKELRSYFLYISSSQYDYYWDWVSTPGGPLIWVLEVGLRDAVVYSLKDIQYWWKGEQYVVKWPDVKSFKRLIIENSVRKGVYNFIMETLAKEGKL